MGALNLKVNHHWINLFFCNIPCAIPIVKVDVSTSCDLTLCNEDVIVETCDDLIAKENDELKQR